MFGVSPTTESRLTRVHGRPCLSECVDRTIRAIAALSESQVLAEQGLIRRGVRMHDLAMSSRNRYLTITVLD